MSSSFKNQTIKTIKREKKKMKKTLLALLSATLLLTTLSPAQAEDQRVLAIIDTAINSKNLPSVIYEACFTQSTTMACPNGKTYMEGKGSASANWPTSINNNTYHGDSMVKAALAVTPTLKIVFVRIADVNSLGNNVIRSESLISAIKWVSDNADKYSIDAVSLSLSGTNQNTCTNQTTVSSVASLGLKNIPTFAATGNEGSKTTVGFPACVPGVIGVGAATDQFDNGIRLGETATNRGPGLDIVAPGKINITKYNGSPTTLSGSSGANVISASRYISKNTYKTFAEYINALPKESIKFVDSRDSKTGIVVWESTRLVSFSSN